MDCAAYQRWFSPYVDALLAQNERDELEAHLNGCPRCRADLESLQAMLRSLRALEQPDTPELLPGIQARLAREPWWQRFARRFVAPWPASLPLHGLALATTAFLVIVVVGLPQVLQAPGKNVIEKNARPVVTGSLVDTKDKEALKNDEATLALRSSVSPGFEALATHASGTFVASRKSMTPLSPQPPLDQAETIVGGATGAATCPPCEKKRAELARQWEEHPQVQWQVNDLASAAAQLNGWVQSKGGSVTTIDEHRLSVTLPEASVSEFLTQFSSSVSAPATISLDSPPDSTRWVTISLELISPE